MMFGAGWMNLTSLGLGLAAWALPLAALALDAFALAVWGTEKGKSGADA